MDSKFLECFEKQIETTKPCGGFLHWLPRDKQLDAVKRMYAVSDAECESFLDRKISETEQYIGQKQLFMIVSDDDTAPRRVISFWDTELSSLADQYDVIEKTDVCPIVRLKKIPCNSGV